MMLLEDILEAIKAIDEVNGTRRIRGFNGLLMGLGYSWTSLMAQMLWTSLLAVGLFVEVLSVSCFSLKAPALIGCVFIHRANVTCDWTTGDSKITHYTLNVQRIPTFLAHNAHTEIPKDRSLLWTCSTPNTSCTVVMEKSVNYNFCISVTDTVATATSPVHHAVSWVLMKSDPGGKAEVSNKFKAHGQPGVKVANVTVTSFSFVVCPFNADTEYDVWLRHRYHSNGSHWSHWSNERRGRTGEDAPSSAPAFGGE
ncbi:hypothetical protein WMY93_016624 [Mugilogobius chulae]|uniref:Uncharacterized protein n=1 Tax=Mugilogobius chulae TaxID=88201 RepID=A0AAW0NW46_9GOBI